MPKQTPWGKTPNPAPDAGWVMLALQMGTDPHLAAVASGSVRGEDPSQACQDLLPVSEPMDTALCFASSLCPVWDWDGNCVLRGSAGLRYHVPLQAGGQDTAPCTPWPQPLRLLKLNGSAVLVKCWHLQLVSPLRCALPMLSSAMIPSHLPPPPPSIQNKEKELPVSVF